MKDVREDFIKLDKLITDYGTQCEAEKIPAGIRTASLARTHIETALQYAIKTLCLLGEQNKEEEK